MIVRETVAEKLKQVEVGDEVEVIWNDAVMIESQHKEDLFADSPVLFEKARAVMRHRGIVARIMELEAGHHVLMLYVRRGAKVMLPRKNGVRYAELRRHALIVIPIPLISEIKIIKKGVGVKGMMAVATMQKIDYHVTSIVPRVTVKWSRRRS